MFYKQVSLVKLADLSGTIYPYGINPVNPSITNKLQYSDYTFGFYTAQDVPKGGFVKVTFPYQFIAGLGFATNPTCDCPCTMSGTDFIVTFTLSSKVVAGVRKQYLVDNHF